MKRPLKNKWIARYNRRSCNKSRCHWSQMVIPLQDTESKQGVSWNLQRKDFCRCTSNFSDLSNSTDQTVNSYFQNLNVERWNKIRLQSKGWPWHNLIPPLSKQYHSISSTPITTWTATPFPPWPSLEIPSASLEEAGLMATYGMGLALW